MSSITVGYTIVIRYGMYGKTSTNNNTQMKKDREALKVDTRKDFNK